MAPDPVRTVARAASGAASHAAWWLRYRLHGQTRPAPVAPRKRQRARSGSDGSGERRSPVLAQQPRGLQRPFAGLAELAVLDSPDGAHLAQRRGQERLARAE